MKMQEFNSISDLLRYIENEADRRVHKIKKQGKEAEKHVKKRVEAKVASKDETYEN